MVVEAWVSRSHRFPREKRRNEEKEKDAVYEGMRDTRRRRWLERGGKREGYKVEWKKKGNDDEREINERRGGPVGRAGGVGGNGGRSGARGG